MRDVLRLINSLVFKRAPLYVHYGITHRCNVRCGMCFIHQASEDAQELSVKEIDTLFDSVRALGVGYVSIGGGEPLLRDDLPAVVQLLSKKGLRVRVLTNGLLADRARIKELVGAGLKEVSISLDSLCATTQDAIYRRKGSWNQIMDAFDLFSALLPSKKGLLINTVVSAFNVDELPQLSHFAHKKGCFISFVPLEGRRDQQFLLSQKDSARIDRSYKSLLAMKKKGGGNIFNSSLFLTKSRQYLKTGQCDWQCDAGRLYFSIDPQGALSMCHSPSCRLVVDQSDLKTFFASREYQKRQQVAVRECMGCMRPCWSELSLLSHDAKSFWEFAKMRLGA